QSLSKLKDVYKDKVALIVGAGPSFEVDAINIKLNRNKYIIISVGSSIQTLLHYEIIPDLMVVMDPSIENEKLFKNELTNDIPLVFVSQFYSEVLNKHDKFNYHAYFDNNCITNF